MSDAWIQMRTDLADDPAVIAIAAATDCTDEDHVVGKLHRLWSWADKHLVDGNAPGVTGAWVDRYVGVTGFAHAMQSVGWLEVQDQGDDAQQSAGITIPKFDLRFSQSAKRRALTARRVARSRQNKKRTGNAPSVTPPLPDALPKEEKRRGREEEEVLVESSRVDHLDSSSCQEAGGTLPRSATGDRPPIDWPAVREFCRRKFKSGNPEPFPGKFTTDDANLLLKLGALHAAGQVSEAEIDDGLQAITSNGRRQPIAPNKRVAYYQTCLREALAKRGCNLYQMLAQVEIPPKPASTSTSTSTN